MDILEIAREFQIQGSPLSAVPISGGHINDTCRVETLTGGRYILQRVNSHVMTNPPLVMENIDAVTRHLREKGMETLTIVPTLEGKLCLEKNGEYYRVYVFIDNADCHLSPKCLEDFKSAGEAFGSFIEALSDMPVGKTHIIPAASHNTVYHLNRFNLAVQRDPLGRADSVREEINMALAESGLARVIQSGLVSGELPLRIVHNDTKYSNIMIDSKTHKARCILDLDNVMPGSLLSDYGDSIRSGCDADGRFDIGLMKAYREGFLKAVKSITPAEAALLPVAPLVITYENALRYLTDYLMGDVYFKIKYPLHNLHKFRRRMKLLEDMKNKLNVGAKNFA